MPAHRGQIFALSVFVVSLALAGWSFLDRVTLNEGNRLAQVSPGELYGGAHFGQTFVASHPDLFRIEVVMSTYGRRNTHNVIFHLKEDVASQTDLVSITLNANDVRDEAWQSFSFPPMPDSAGKSFYFYLESPESEPGNAVTVMGREGNPYPGGQAFVSGQPVPGDMAFRVNYAISWQQKIELVLEGLTANKPSIWGSRCFYILLAVLYVILLGALLWQISGAVFSEESHHDR